MTEERDETFSSRLSNLPRRLDALKPARSFPLLSLTGTFKSPFSVKYTPWSYQDTATNMSTFPTHSLSFFLSFRESETTEESPVESKERSFVSLRMTGEFG